LGFHPHHLLFLLKSTVQPLPGATVLDAFLVGGHVIIPRPCGGWESREDESRLNNFGFSGDRCCPAARWYLSWFCNLLLHPAAGILVLLAIFPWPDYSVPGSNLIPAAGSSPFAAEPGKAIRPESLCNLFSTLWSTP